MSTEEFLSPLAQEAVTLREMFVAFVAGGFTEDQALRLIAYQLAANGRAVLDQEKGSDS